MAPVAPGTRAPDIPGTDLSEGLRAVFFYKVTCPTCQMAAPVAERLARSDGDRFTAVAQDPPEQIEVFAREYDTSFSSVPDQAPYALSDAYGIRTVPTVFAVQDGLVVDVVESWDRDGWNRIGHALGAGDLSHEGDGLPPFRPG
ncbi:MAG TPA: hypothetical protein VGB28_00680 [Actinomycetota bacterium]|jgi:thiol-disulfide isomerase/thioredoxin